VCRKKRKRWNSGTHRQRSRRKIYWSKLCEKCRFQNPTPWRTHPSPKRWWNREQKGKDHFLCQPRTNNQRTNKPHSIIGYRTRQTKNYFGFPLAKWTQPRYQLENRKICMATTTVENQTVSWFPHSSPSCEKPSSRSTRNSHSKINCYGRTGSRWSFK
jgi:hypothetical protein